VPDPSGICSTAAQTPFRPLKRGRHAEDAEQAQTPPPAVWSIYKLAAKQRWLGLVEATDEAAAIAKAAEQFRVPAMKLMAVKRR